VQQVHDEAPQHDKAAQMKGNVVQVPTAKAARRMTRCCSSITASIESPLTWYEQRYVARWALSSQSRELVRLDPDDLLIVLAPGCSWL
jgi:hypothetical protein